MLSWSDFLIKLIFTDYLLRKKSVNFWTRLNNKLYFSCFLLYSEVQNNYGASDKTSSLGIYNCMFFQKYPDSGSAKPDFLGVSGTSYSVIFSTGTILQAFERI